MQTPSTEQFNFVLSAAQNAPLKNLRQAEQLSSTLKTVAAWIDYALPVVKAYESQQITLVPEEL